MSQDVLSAPNEHVREVYDRLGDLLDQGDDAFVDEGPALLRRAIRQPGFFDGVETEPATDGSYTRTKVVGDPDGHVIRFMEWPPGYSLCPHEHHGRPCFEVLVDGLLHVVDMDVTRVEEKGVADGLVDENGDADGGLYELSILDCGVTEPGQSAVVDPRDNDVHSVYSPVRSRSLHVYPDDQHFSYGYVLDEDAGGERDRYRRERFDLDE
ncbi:hypothetical protein [Haloarchaeobius sp. TZWWS8]|uniref:hypothetical protein n=1 Tax=Haloarchaeobius sp. TZWWS8 TaxID=3446121 RepID=UPI003EB69841